MCAPAEPARATVPVSVAKRGVDWSVTRNAGVPLANLRVNVSPETVADVMAGVSGAEDAGGNEADAGPDVVQAVEGPVAVAREDRAGGGTAGADAVPAGAVAAMSELAVALAGAAPV